MLSPSGTVSDIDAYGLLKLDVLGLRNLDIISKAVAFIKETTGEDVDPDHLPHPNTKGDPRVQATWELLRSGRTAGIFQMESVGMSNLAQQIKPDRLGDLSAVVALFRPGPLSANMHLMYADRKNGLQEVDYSIFTDNVAEQEAIATVLGETYGVFVYQEQLMRLATVIAGFDAKGRSKLRKAVGKKIKSVMDEVGEELIAGAPLEVRDEETGEIISPVFSQATAARVFDYMKGSAEYLFNASHSFAYAQLAYVTAFLKANWPAEYGAAILATTSAADKRLLALRSLREEGIEVLAPDVNRPRRKPARSVKSRFCSGLSEIKGVGAAGQAIAEDLAAHGPFSSVRHLLHRVSDELGKSMGRSALSTVSSKQAHSTSGAAAAVCSRSLARRKPTTLHADDFEWGILERSTRQRRRLGVIVGAAPDGGHRPGLLGPARSDRRGLQRAGRPASALSASLTSPTWTVKPRTLSVSSPNGRRRRTRRAEWSTSSSSRRRRASDASPGTRPSRGCGTPSRVFPTVGSIVAVNAKVSVRELDIEDEEGNVIEQVKTKELTVSGIRVPDHGLSSPPYTRPEPVESPLRKFITIDYPQVRAPKPEVKAKPEPAAEEPFRAPVNSVAVLDAADGAVLPVVVWDLERPDRNLVGSATNLEDLHDDFRYGKTVRWMPRKPVLGEEAVALALKANVPIAFVYSAKLANGEALPATWQLKDGVIPTKDDLLFVSQPDRVTVPESSYSDDWDDLEFA